MRTIKNINNNWKFIQENLSLEQVSEKNIQWKELDLPHTWNAYDGANGNDYYRGVGWYVRELAIPVDEAMNHLFIEFQGANSVTDVYVNDQWMGQHKGGYATFRFDITKAIRFGEKNTLAVKVDNSEHADVYPLRADFTFYGGIYRNVQLISVTPVHIDLEDYGSSGVFIEQQNVSEEQATLQIKTKLQNKTDEPTSVRLWLEVLDQAGKVVAYRGQNLMIQPGSNEETLTLKINEPNLWNGHDNPYLYSMKISLQKFNDTIDRIDIPFGVRYFEVDPEKGFILNGKPLRLNGVARHQDRKGKGWAISQADQREDMALIKEIGATSIRLAHYQHDQYFYDLCDQEGMVVWAEIPFITEVSKAENPDENAKQQLIELIRQNYNHPSIFFWGIQNEIQIDAANEGIARKLVKELDALARTEDQTRLTTMANVLTVDDEDEYNYITDIIGFNKYYGWYMGKAEDFADWIDHYHHLNPTTALAITEYGAEGIVEYHSANPVVQDYTEEYHALFHEKVWKIFSARPFLWATYVWNMFDFGANIRDEGGVKGRNNKGLVTFDRQIKKDAFYFYKANWSPEPFVHLAGKRYIERSGETTTIKVYTNCPSVTLSVNSQKVATVEVTNGIALFEHVPLEKGENWLVATATNESKEIKDQSLIIQVETEPEAYRAPVEEAGENVQNWFEVPAVEEEAEAVEIPDGVYSTRDTLEELMTHEETRQHVIDVMGDLTQIPMYGMMKNMKIDTLVSMSPDGTFFNQNRVNLLNKKLIQVKKEGEMPVE